MNNINHTLISFLTCAMRGEVVSPQYTLQLSDEEIKEIYKLSKKHDLTHLIGVALENTAPKDKQRYKPFFFESVKAMYRYEWLKGEHEKICSLLEQNHIPYIPLKGSVIRSLYIEPWHRTSCDIDILIPEDRLEEAVSAFETTLAYTRGKHSRHDVSLTAPNGVHLELHFDFDEEYVDCSEIWSDAKPVTEGNCQYSLSSEMIVLTHIAHMAKHFIGGGCGLRPFLDLWLMREKLPYDRAKLERMLGEHRLAEFSRTMFGIVDVWFDGKKPAKVERMAEAYILPAGVYGDLDHKISVNRAEGKSKFAYTLERIFPPRSSLKIAYPILNKHPWLLPICWVRRWFRLIRAGKLKQVKIEYDINRRLNTDELNNTCDLLKQLGLTP